MVAELIRDVSYCETCLTKAILQAGHSATATSISKVILESYFGGEM